MKVHKRQLILLEIVMLAIALMFVFPLIMVFYNSFKSFSEVMVDALALPKSLSLSNYTYVWKYINYPKLFCNNVIVTVVGIVGIVLFPSLAAYKMSRTKTRLSGFLYLLCITPMLIPFQTIMIAVLKIMTGLHLDNNIWGLGVQYWGFFAPLAVFMYHGFVKTIPQEIDESAIMDGASPTRLFFQIIFPLLKGITSTLIIIDALRIWNDFLLPLIMVNSSKSNKTLTLAIYSFMGEYISDWQYAMTAMVMAILPSILFFIVMQKNIVRGVVAGAVKG